MESFGDYFNKKLIEYNISEAKFAKATGIAQKSVNRYRNGETKPDEARRAQIIDFFNKLETGKSLEEAKYEQEHTVGYDEEGRPIILPDFEDDSIFASQMIPTGSEKLMFFTPTAQKYIVDNYYMIGAMNPDEFEFVDKMRACDEKKRKKIIDYMQRLPENIDMYIPEDYGPDSFESINPMYDYYSKCNEYKRNVYQADKYPGTWNNTIDPDTGEQRFKLIKELNGQFQSNNFFAADSGIDGNMVIDNANKISDYTRKDWYCLYMYARTRLYDYTCEDMEWVKYKEMLMGWNALKVWKMLEYQS